VGEFRGLAALHPRSLDGAGQVAKLAHAPKPEPVESRNRDWSVA